MAVEYIPARGGSTPRLTGNTGPSQWSRSHLAPLEDVKARHDDGSAGGRDIQRRADAGVEALPGSESGDEVAFDDELVIFEKDRTCE
ncbi:MAG: hypothetical protein A2W35_06825 [Chloroflexi bacterium RBG_16_57_11]|nr:MAG: hypothetical protein A2W35_06825 [Chloroflexi bacterium RBG_16_57_11]